ncbi:MAG: response regulator [Methylococcales bacterium]|nr:response regulator [Methylococcales bacterium]
METVAAFLVLSAGLLSLVRFYSGGGLNFVILGAGFVGVACLDGFHTVVTSSWFKGQITSDLPSLIPWSGFSSRLFLSLVFLAGCVLLKLEIDRRLTLARPIKLVCSVTIVLTLMSGLFFSFIPMPDVYYPGLVIHRPEALVLACAFLLALVFLLRWGQWQTESFHYWVALSLIVNCFSEGAFMAMSNDVFDLSFVAAHLLKIVSYVCLLIGLSLSIFSAFKSINQTANSENTVRRKAQEALEHSEIRHRTIVSSLADGLITLNDKGIIESINAAACGIFGYSKLELLGRNIRKLMPSSTANQHDRYLNIFAETNKRTVVGATTEVEGLRKEGSTFPLELSVSEMWLGKRRKFSGIVRDISDRKKFQEEIIQARNVAEEAALAKSRFLATMSHEIRTPMNGVLGMIEVLKQTALDKNQQNILSVVSESGQSLLSIINDILDFSKLESGKIELEKASFDLEKVVYDVAHLLTIKAQGKDIELILYCHAGIPEIVVGDAGRIRQVLINLVGNAIKFTSRGRVVIEVTSEIRGEGHSLVRFEVKDTGVGFDASVKDKLFESFTQEDASTSRRFGGTGLGLSICKQLTDAMGGQIGVTSTVNQGSNFWVEIPLQVSAIKRTGSAALNGCRILLVDDSTLNGQVLSEMLQYRGAVVTQSFADEEVMPILNSAISVSQPYDLVIINQPISSVDGEQLGLKIKAQTALCQTPLVLFTESTEKCSDQQLKDNLFIACISKPILSYSVQETLERVLGHATKSLVDIAEEVLPATEPVLSGRILLVEDVIVNQKVAVGLMAPLAVEIDIANNGEEAVEKYLNNQYDLILMDCQMPVMDGYDATKKIRAIENGSHVNIVAATANVLPADIAECMAAGMDGYLSKPFDQKQLFAVLQEWMGGEAVNAEAIKTKQPLDQHQSAVDFIMLNKMRKDIGTAFSGLIPAFLVQADEMLNSLPSLISSGEYGEVERVAHSLKSSGLTVGAKPFSSIALQLEHEVRNEFSDDSLTIAATRLKTEYKQVKTILQEYQVKGE